jgi:hypothetical protein
MKMTQKRTSLALVSAGLIAMAIPMASHADVMASAVVVMTNFTITNNTTNAILDATGTQPGGTPTGDLSFLTFTSTGGYDISINGVGPLPASSSAAPVDLPAACTGDGCAALALVNNNFPKLAAPPAGNYAAADQNEFGAPVSGIPGFATPANVANASYAGLTTQQGLSSSDANNNLQSSFVFILNQEGSLTFDFDVDAWLQVAVTSDEIFPGFATAAYSMEFSIVNLSNNSSAVWSFAPTLFPENDANGDPIIGGVKTLSLNAPLPIDIQSTRDTGGPVSFSSITPTLAANTLYQLSARINTNVDAQRVNVPEPGILALLGMGLLGLGLSRRRKGV